jgi:hypothetical protein
MTNAEQLAPQEKEEIAANGTKAEDFSSIRRRITS